MMTEFCSMFYKNILITSGGASNMLNNFLHKKEKEDDPKK
jgi:hypothetical protein